MPDSTYHMVSHWRVLATTEEVYDVLIHGEDLPRWWPAAFLSALSIQSGEADGEDKVTRLETRGWLPYTLHWHVVVEDADPPKGFSTKVWGDFEGTGVWAFAQDENWVDITYDWRIKVNKPLVRYLSPLLKPLFVSNHRWAMAKGEESLRLELARRRAASLGVDTTLLEPPGEVRYPPLPVALGLGATLAVLLVRWRHES